MEVCNGEGYHPTAHNPTDNVSLHLEPREDRRQAYQSHTPDSDQLIPIDVTRVYRCNRILVGKTPNLTTAAAVLT